LSLITNIKHRTFKREVEDGERASGGAGSRAGGAVEWIKEEREKRKEKRKRGKKEKRKKSDKWALQWIEDDIEYGWVREKLI
jgi:hypothetical protein